MEGFCRYCNFFQFGDAIFFPNILQFSPKSVCNKQYCSCNNVLTERYIQCPDIIDEYAGNVFVVGYYVKSGIRKKMSKKDLLLN